LRGQYRLAMLSNVNEMHWTFNRDRHAFMQWFEIPIASYAVGLRKPEPAIFQHVLDKAGVRADKAVFTDDLEAHTLAAAAIGIRSHIFTTAAQLKTDLKDFL
jgi:FMN phosphatase YigB (HAD superfamily)